MYKILKADKDAYITDKVIQDTRKETANVGAASSLDLFKLYGLTESGSLPNIELSRLLIHFDLDPIRDLITAGKLDITNPSFSCKLNMYDVDGGQTVPENFTLTVHPLSRSFDEGRGRDIVTFGDIDVCNFLTGSRAQGPWLLSGANLGGPAYDAVDYITLFTESGISSSVEVTQVFAEGTEDLSVDVTTIVSATLAGLLPDEGFRVAFTSSHETNNQTYFAKRFAARKAFDPTFHPTLTMTFDDSVQDDSTILRLDTSGSVFLYTFANGSLANLVSGSSEITGSSSLKLRLQTAISGGFYDLSFSGSQHVVGSVSYEGVYSASVLVPSSDSTVSEHIAQSGSIDFVPIWESLDGTVAYLTGSKLTVLPPLRGGSAQGTHRYDVNVFDVKTTYSSTETSLMRVNIFDKSNPRIKLVKQPVEMPGIVVRDVHYQIRYAESERVVIPFDTVYNSTRVSADADGMYFMLDTTNLAKNRAYVVDIMIVSNGVEQLYKEASPVFRVSDVR